MWDLSSPTRDRIQATAMKAQVLATGPPENSSKSFDSDGINLSIFSFINFFLFSLVLLVS